MHTGLLFALTAIVAIIPLIALSWRTGFSKGAAFWAATALACAGPASEVVSRSLHAWQADFATTIWVTIAVTMALFLIFAILVESVWRLAPLLSAYMLVLTLIGLAWQHDPSEPVPAAGTAVWLTVHIVLAVTTYGLATLAAVAALAAFIQERALKRKQKPMLDGVLPSITDCDRLETRFLALGEVILGLGLATGVALNLKAGNGLISFDHKTVFTFGAFVTIGLLLYAQARHGLRGRRAARFVLLAYLFLTLGYPGVKFVTDVLLS